MRRRELEELTKVDILELAKKLEIAGRSSLSKDGLITAVMKAQVKKRRQAFARAAKKNASARKKVASAARTTKQTALGSKKKVTKKKTITTAVRKKTVRKKTAVSVEKATARKKASASAPKTAARKKAPAARAPKATPAPRARKKPKKVPASPTPQQASPPSPPTAAEAAPPSGSPLRMPDRYGTDFVGLMVRDPYWLHAYWEVTEKTVDRVRRQLANDWDGHRSVLRIYAFPPDTPAEAIRADNGEDRYDVDLPEGCANWYVNVGRPDRIYQVAVGVVSRSGKFVAYARSNPVTTPRDSVSPITDEEWTSTPETFRRLYEMASPPDAREGRASAEIGMLLRERLRSDWASGMLASMGSEELARKPEGRGFWFILDAELIVYGATEADAKVTVQGRPVELRPDGTFSLRFQLPDGTQVIDATAVSSDGAFRKTITPTVRRETRATEMIESRPHAREAK